MSRLALGTAQFGLDYGITNRNGRIGDDDAAAILDLAARNGIDTLDTARLYGKSEETIGRHWPSGAGFKIVTKTGKFDGAEPGEAVRQLRAGFDASLDALGRDRVHGLLLHDPQDLLGPIGPALWSAMEELRRAGRATRIGASVYEGAEIDAILARYPIEVVQLPFNAIDRRLAEGGQLQALAAAGVEIHARSVFLQGLLLAPAAEFPAKFAPVRSALEGLDRQFARKGLGRLEGLLAIAFSRPEIARFVVGVTSPAELEAIIVAAERAEAIGSLAVDIPAIDGRYFNPARWGELE